MSSTGSARAKTIAKHFQRILAFFGGLTLLALSTVFFFFLGVGHWLVKEDPLQKADAIAVLSGNIPVRALEAAALYHEGYAAEIWLTHPGARADALSEFGLRYPSEDDFNYRVLRRQGIPAKAIHILESPIQNTADELDVISSAIQSVGAQSVIVVTDKPHTRRVHTLWEEFDASRGKAIVRGVSGDTYDPSRWWKTANGTRQVMHEVFGLINAWAGLPVQSDIQVQRSVAAISSGEPNTSHVFRVLSRDPTQSE
jgi:uncharacterized SAM-binding protein YcdF (DUF218 family)